MVSFAVEANPSKHSRSGTLTIGSYLYNIKQAGNPLDMTLTPPNASIGAEGGVVSVNVALAGEYTDVSWNATSHQPSWLTITAGAHNSGNGTVKMQVSSLTSVKPRTGSLTIGDKTFTVTQSGVTGTVTVTPATLLLPAEQTKSSVTINTNVADYTWTATTTTPWLTLTSGEGGHIKGGKVTGTGTGHVQIAASANTASSRARTGTVTINDQTLTVTQVGAAGELSVTPSAVSMEAAGGTRSVSVAANYADYNWTAKSNADWITLTAGATGTGSGPLTLQIAALPTAEPRSGTVTVGNQTVTVTQTVGVMVTPADVTLTAMYGGTPVAQNLSVVSGSNAPHAPYKASTGANAAWLSLDSASGTMPATLRLTANPAGLAIGTYSASITVNGRTVPVTFTVRPPVVSVSQSLLFFQKTNGSATVAPKAVIVSAEGGPVTFTATAQPANSGWLRVQDATGTAPSAIQVQVSTDGLPPGEYTGAVRIDITSPMRESILVPVTLRMPLLDVNVASTSNSTPAAPSVVADLANGQIGFFASSQEPANAPPPTATLLVGANAVNRDFVANGSTVIGGKWLSVWPTSGTTPANLNIAVDRTGLAPGVYTGYVTLTTRQTTVAAVAASAQKPTTGLTTVALADAASAQVPKATVKAASNALEVLDTVTMAITFTVDAPSSNVRVSPSAIKVTQALGLSQPDAVILQVDGTPGQTFYAASASGPWLTVAPSSGTVPAQVIVRVDGSQQTQAGMLTGSVAFTTPQASAQPVLVPVHLALTPQMPLIRVANSGLSLTAEEASSAVSVPVLIEAPQGRAPYTTSTSVPWLSVAAVTGNAPEQVRITANPAGLAAGVYQGVVRVMSGPDRAEVNVTFTVQPKPSLASTGGPLALRVMNGGAVAPSPVTVAVSSTVRPLTVTARLEGQAAGWLTVASNPATTPANWQVGVTPEALRQPAGTYTATLVLTADGAANNPLRIPVTLTVDNGVPTLTQPNIVGLASRRGGAVAPGLLVSLMGLSLPIEQPATASLTGTHALVQLAGVRVLFDGQPAPVLRASTSEVQVMVPYEVAGKGQTTVQLEYLGQASAPVLMPVVPTRPEILSTPGEPDSYARHPDGTPVSALAPAAPGSLIMVAASGLGAMQPVLDSTLIQRQAVPVRLASPVEVLLDGVACEVLFVGPMPGQVPGLIQFNVRVPSSLGSGEGHLQLRLRQITADPVTVAEP